MSSPSESTIVREYVRGRSWSSWFFWWILKLFLPILKRKDVIAPRGPQTLDFPPPNLGPCSAVRWSHKDWTMVELGPSPRPGNKGARRAMMYLYGAGFQRPIHSRQWAFASYMAEELDADTSVVPYPLPPLNNAKEVVPALAEVYRAFLERAGDREVILLGDSGGAHVLMCLLYHLASNNPTTPFPHQLILISPNLNTEMNNPAIYSLAPYDPALNPAHCIFVNRLWAGGDPSLPVSPEDASNPAINPMAGDVSLLRSIPTLPRPVPSHQSSENDVKEDGKAEMEVVLVSGGYDVLHADILVWLEKAEEAGLKVHYIEGVRQIHDFPTGRKLIWEGRVVTDRVIEIVKERSLRIGFGEDDGRGVTMEV